MATITLHKSEFDGVGSLLDKLCSCFGNFDSTIKDLKRTASGIDSTTCNLEDVINDIAESEERKEEKVKRAKELNSKLNTFINSAAKHENDAAKEIKKQKKDFYKKYSYLKPDSEKFLGKVGAFFESVGKWISENAIALIVAAIIVLAAIVIVIVCPASVCAILAIIVGVASALMGIGDIVCMALTGKDFAGWLDSKGFHVLSQIYTGLGWGLDIASLILPLGALPSAGASAYKTTLKELFRHPLQSLKNFGKNPALSKLKGILKTPFKSLKGFIGNGAKAFKSKFDDGIIKGLGTLGKDALNGAIDGLKDVVGFDDLKNGVDLLKAIKGGARGSEIGNSALKILGLGGIPTDAFAGTEQDKYNAIVAANKTDLNAAVDANNLSPNNAGFSEMNFEYKPETGSDAANALDNLRAGTNTEPSSTVYKDMRSSFYDSVKGDSNLSQDLFDATGVKVSDCSDYKSFERALKDNGFTLDANIGQAGGKANVNVVPTWSYHTTGVNTPGGNMAIRDLNNMSNAAGFSGDTVGAYNKYINTKSRLFTNNYISDLGQEVFDGAKDLAGDGISNALGLDDKTHDFLEKNGFNPNTNPFLKAYEAFSDL